MNATRAPSRAEATAWFAPFPPKAWRNICPSTVSPGSGSFGPLTKKSVLAPPTTTTSYVFILHRSLGKWARPHDEERAKSPCPAVNLHRIKRVIPQSFCKLLTGRQLDRESK